MIALIRLLFALMATPFRSKSVLEAENAALRQQVLVLRRKLRGRVVRVDPAVVDGAVRVEVDFDESLPESARADLSVDGVIAVETLPGVRYMGRPVGAQSEATTTVFRVRPGTNVAERVKVRLGKASVNQIVVLEGLEPGDVVALADTTQWAGRDRLVID